MKLRAQGPYSIAIDSFIGRGFGGLHRRDTGARGPRRRAVECLLVLPRPDDPEVVRAHRVGEDIEAHVAFLEPALLRRNLQHPSDLRIGRDVHAR